MISKRSLYKLYWNKLKISLQISSSAWCSIKNKMSIEITDFGAIKEIQEIWLARKVHVIIFFIKIWKAECCKKAKQGSKTSTWDILVLKSQDVRAQGAVEYCSTLLKTQKLCSQVAYCPCKIQKLINQSVSNKIYSDFKHNKYYICNCFNFQSTVKNKTRPPWVEL